MASGALFFELRRVRRRTPRLSLHATRRRGSKGDFGSLRASDVHIFQYGRGDVLRRGIGRRVAAGRFRCDVSKATQSPHPVGWPPPASDMPPLGRAWSEAGGDLDHSSAVVDAGWTLRGGSDPDASALANLWPTPAWSAPTAIVGELILLVTGGLGAGYILWQFERHDSRIVTLGFTNSLRNILTGGCRRRLPDSVSTRTGPYVRNRRSSGRTETRARRGAASHRLAGPLPDRFGNCPPSTALAATQSSPTPNRTVGST